MPIPKVERVIPSPFHSKTAEGLKNLVDEKLKDAETTIENLTYKIGSRDWLIGDEIDLTVAQEMRYTLNLIKSRLITLGFYDKN